MEQQQKNVAQITPNQLDCLVECATLEVRERTENEISNHHRNHSYSSSNNSINNRLPINPQHHGLRRRTNGLRTIRYGSRRHRSTRIHKMEHERNKIMALARYLYNMFIGLCIIGFVMFTIATIFGFLPAALPAILCALILKFTL